MRTFEFELRFLKEHYFDLFSDVFVFIVDGDMAKLAALKAVFPSTMTTKTSENRSK
jgi:hypothetical protein